MGGFGIATKFYLFAKGSPLGAAQAKRRQWRKQRAGAGAAAQIFKAYAVENMERRNPELARPQAETER